MTCDKTPKCAEPCGLCPEQWPVPAGSEVPTLADRLSDEADQARNDGAEDIAKLLDEAVCVIRAFVACTQVSRGNVASLGPAGALDKVYTPYQVWLEMLDGMLARAGGKL